MFYYYYNIIYIYVYILTALRGHRSYTSSLDLVLQGILAQEEHGNKEEDKCDLLEQLVPVETTTFH